MISATLAFLMFIFIVNAAIGRAGGFSWKEVLRMYLLMLAIIGGGAAMVGISYLGMSGKLP